MIGDGTKVVLGDHVRIPEHVCGRRAGMWGEVVKLGDEGLGIRFEETVSGITREFFEWEDGRAVAFLCFNTLVFIHEPSGSAQKASISVKIEPKTVYVCQSERGRGHGVAFVGVVALQIPAVLGRLEAMSRGLLRDLQVGSISVGIEAECVSEEGSRFVHRAFEACERELKAFAGTGRWPVSRKLGDHIDHGGCDEGEWLDSFTA